MPDPSAGGAHLAARIDSFTADADLVLGQVFVGVVIELLHGTIVAANSRALAFLETDVDTLVGRHLQDLVAPELHAELEEVLERLRVGEPSAEILTPWRSLGPGPRWISLLLRVPDDRPHLAGVAISDITSQVRTQNRLDDSEALANLLAQNARDIVLILGEDDRCTWVSPSISGLSGWSTEDFLALGRWDLIHPDDREMVRHARESQTTGFYEVEPVRMLKSDGSFLWVSARGQLSEGLRGEPTWVIQLRDITSVVQALEEQRASERVFRVLAENAHDVVLCVSEDYVVTWASPSLQSTLGWPVDEIIGRPSIELVDERDRDRVDAARRVELDHSALQVRYRTAEGSSLWFESQRHPLPHDSLGARVIGLRLIDTEVEAKRALDELEDRFRVLAQTTSDVIFEVGTDATISWVSPSVDARLGWDASELVGRHTSDLIHHDDWPAIDEVRGALLKGGISGSTVARLRRRDGNWRWMEVSEHGRLDEVGSVISIVCSLRDVHEEVVAARALRTLTRGGLALVNATSDLDLLQRICNVAVSDGGYAIAGYARRDPGGILTPVAVSDNARVFLDDPDSFWLSNDLRWGPGHLDLEAGQTFVIGDLSVDPRAARWRERAVRQGVLSMAMLPVTVEGVVEGLLAVFAHEIDGFDAQSLTTLRSLAEELGLGLTRSRDLRRITEALDNQQLLTSAIEEAADAIIIAAPDSSILYANPAAVRSSGYSMEELLGANPRLLQSGLHPHEFYEKMWQTLLSGRSWRGEIFNRRKNGELYEEDVTISPVRNALGTLVAYVAVKHDLTTERRLRQDLSREHQDRSAVVEVMRQLRRSPTLTEGATRFCQTVIEAAQIDVAGIALTRRDGGLIPVATVGTSYPPPEGLVLDVDWPETLADVRSGPIEVDLHDRSGRWPGAEAMTDALAADGILALAMAPVRWEGELVALLAIGTRDREQARDFSSRFALFEELGGYAGTLLGAQIKEDVSREALHGEIDGILAHQRFAAVFQPLVEMTTGQVVGYEALTRFLDGTPDEIFAKSRVAGASVELELAVAREALGAFTTASERTSGMWLNLNLSPDALRRPDAVELLGGWPFEIVIEVTEHEPIEDYGLLRDSLARLAHCRLAVDDAGAGYTSLTHILRLHPDFIKLDMSLVRGISQDAARQAMVAGIMHFARETSTRIVAEGIEEAADAATVRELADSIGLGSLIGQGFLYGRPAPLSARTASS